MKNILITGAAGFIGSHLSETLLEAGFYVTGIDNFDPFYDRNIKENNLQSSVSNPNFKFIQLDLTNQNELTEKLTDGVDCVIHLAAKAGVVPSLNDPEGYIKTNIIGTQHLLEWMKAGNVKKLVFASSSSVYGNNKKIPFSETDPVNEAISPYAFTKRSCEIMNYSYHYLYNIDIVNMRFFTVYGPRQRPDLAIHKFVKLIDSDEPITMYGDGSTSRDYTFINDTVSGIVSALNYIIGHNKIYEIINLGNNKPVQLRDLISTIYTLMGKQQNVIKKPARPGEVEITYANIEKAKSMLQYYPSTSLEDGLRSFIAWYNAKK